VFGSRKQRVQEAIVVKTSFKIQLKENQFVVEKAGRGCEASSKAGWFQTVVSNHRELRQKLLVMLDLFF
jgi:hypothetical protein